MVRALNSLFKMLRAWVTTILLSGDNLGQVVCTHVPLSPSSISASQEVLMPCGWEGNRRFGVTLVMCHRLQWFIDLQAYSPRKRDEHTLTPYFTGSTMSDCRRPWSGTWSCPESGTFASHHMKWSSRRNRCSRSSTGATWWLTRRTASRMRNQRWATCYACMFLFYSFYAAPDASSWSRLMHHPF